MATSNPRLMEQERDLEKLLAKEPNSYELLSQMGNTQFDLGNYAKATSFYEKARAIRSDSPDLFTDLGVCYKETGQPRKAIELFQQAMKLSPSHWQSRYNAATVLVLDLNDAQGAKAELDKLKQVKAEHPELGIPDLTGLENEIAKRSK